MNDLSLRRCKLNDTSSAPIFFSVMINKQLKKLDLSENQLTSKSGESIKICLQSNSSLQELYLAWNNLDHEAGINLLSG